MQMTAPAPVSKVYSEMNMKLSLVTEADIAAPCAGEKCAADRAFDQRVLRLGSRLAQEAFTAYPDLSERIKGFDFIIAEKAGSGSVSSANGAVVVFRGLQAQQLDEQTLGFVIAREMGHVIGRHHDENAATGLWFSVLAAVVMPVSSLLSGSAVLTQTASSAATSTAVTSAASFIGSRITIASYKQDQLREADTIALNLLGRMGWSGKEVAEALVADSRIMGDDEWSKDLRASAEDVVALAAAPNRVVGLDVDSSGEGGTLITVGLAQPLSGPPAGFTTDSPPRIILDLPNTTNGLGRTVQNPPAEGLHDVDIVQSDGRTRLAITLTRMLPWRASVEGNNLLIELQDRTADVAVLGDASGFVGTAVSARQ